MVNTLALVIELVEEEEEGQVKGNGISTW